MAHDEPTVLACLTPLGRGAIATLAVRGREAWTITRQLFRPKSTKQALRAAASSLPEQPAPKRVWLGWLGEPSQTSADEVVLAVKSSDPPWLEMHCHGGPQVVEFVQRLYQARGCQIVTWQEFERVLQPAWRVAAQEVLVHTPTARTASSALDQWHGAFHSAVERIRAEWLAGRKPEVIASLRRQSDLIEVGRHLAAPWRVVLTGSPNVGKSSLCNALAGYTRSVVAPTPGTTRDVVTTLIALDGWPIEIADTAGLRSATDDLEHAGMARAHHAAAEADLCIWIVDGSSEATVSETTPDRTLLAINKVDLPCGWDWDLLPDSMRVSAKTQVGLPELCQAIVNRLVPVAPLPGEGVPYTERQWNTLDRITRTLTDDPETDIAALLHELLQ